MTSENPELLPLVAPPPPPPPSRKRCPISSEKLEQLEQFIGLLLAQPELLDLPELQFFKEYIQSQSTRLLPTTTTKTMAETTATPTTTISTANSTSQQPCYYSSTPVVTTVPTATIEEVPDHDNDDNVDDDGFEEELGFEDRNTLSCCYGDNEQDRPMLGFGENLSPVSMEVDGIGPSSLNSSENVISGSAENSSSSEEFFGSAYYLKRKREMQEQAEAEELWLQRQQPQPQLQIPLLLPQAPPPLSPGLTSEVYNLIARVGIVPPQL